MFVQVATGTVRDRDLLAEREEVWRKEVQPVVTGFLGSTSGVTADGTFVLLARFESEQRARENNDRPEQTAWFEGTAKAFDGPLAFRESSDVQLLAKGGSDGAGFVQVMEGRAKDEAAMRADMDGMEDELLKMRPDLLGATIVWHGDGSFTQAVYFKSLEDARKGEQTMSDDPAAQRFMDMLDGPMTFYDLTEPNFT
jgi:hypothetical protein